MRRSNFFVNKKCSDEKRILKNVNRLSVTSEKVGNASKNHYTNLRNLYIEKLLECAYLYRRINLLEKQLDAINTHKTFRSKKTYRENKK